MERATKSGFALEAQQKVKHCWWCTDIQSGSENIRWNDVPVSSSFQIYGKYDPSIAGGLLNWIADTTGLGFDTDGQLDNFVRVLKDGTVLCT
jgi:hypothetical protein